VWKRNLLTLTEQQKQRHSPCDSVFDDSEDDDLEEISSTTASVVSPIAVGFSGHTSSWRVAKSLRPVKDCWNRCDYPSECRWGKQFGVDTPVQVSFPTLERVASTPNPNTDSSDIADVEMSDAPLATLPKTRFTDILTAEQQSVAETLDGVDIDGVPHTHTHTPTPALADLATLVSRAQRRHSKSEIPSPLASPHVGAVTQQQRPTMTTRSSSRESLRRAVEGGIGVIAGLVGGWRSSSAPAPVGRRKEEVEVAGEGDKEDVVMEDVAEGGDEEEQESGRGRGRRRSLG
jgi:hypothetical protein